MKDRQHNGQKKKEILIGTTSSRISYKLRNINRLLTSYAVSRYLCRLNFHPKHLNSSRVYLWNSCCSICSFLCSVFEIIIGPFIFFLLSNILSVLQFTVSDCSFDILDFLLNFCISKLHRSCYCSHWNTCITIIIWVLGSHNKTGIWISEYTII